MTSETREHPKSFWKNLLAALVLVFGVITLFKAGSILFGPQSARDSVGDFVPFVVKFNFAAGFLYILSAVGIWRGRSWAYLVSAIVALGTIIAATVFAGHVALGGSYEMQTVFALGFRAVFWIVVSLILRPKRAIS